MRLSRSDVAVSAALLLGAAGLMSLFVADLETVSGRNGEKELGTVVFKKLSATRKASSAFGWEQMRNDSPVYNADTLRTADLSEATVYFDDGTSLDMLEDSMLRLDFGGKTKNLEFISGEIGVGSSQKATSYTISSTAGKISVDKGAKATFSREAGTLSVEVNQGGAHLVKADGSTQAIAANQELQVDVKSGASAFVYRPIVPVAPEPNARLLSFAGGDKAAVDFAWQSGGAEGEGRNVRAQGPYDLEVSPAADFSADEVAARSVAGLAARIELAAGTWYWRVRDSAGKESPVRRFSIDLAAAPDPVYPPEGQVNRYRSVKPEVGFAWTAMEEASSYLFEIASDPDFAKPVLRSRTTTTSLSVDSLGEGSWYWRVSPIHTFTVVGDTPTARARSFVIAKKAAMAPLALTAPYDASLYQIQDIAGKGLDFSWVPEAEAVSYELVVSKARDLSSPILKIASTRPYASLSGGQAASLDRPGTCYWGVSWVDSEGKTSPPSPARLLQGIDGSIAVRLSFPPEGYRIADSLVQDTRFSWKSNVNARTVFQLARDTGFHELLYEETVSADTLIGHEWKSGRYYWRLRTYNVDGSVFMETPARSFEVVEPFAPPTLLNPAPDSTLYLHGGDTARFTWAPIEGADHYTLTLSSAADNDASTVLEKNFLEATSLVYPLGDLPSGAYKLSIQGFASSGETTTRIIGYIGETGFTYKRLSYIELESPLDGAHVPGLDARAGKEVFVSDRDDAPYEAELAVSTDPAGSQVVARVPDRFGRASVGRLNPGVYYWTVTGSVAGLDVSAKERFRFEVDPVPPPRAAALLAPVGDTFYRIQDIDEKGLRLSWGPEAGAASYELVVSEAPDLSAPLVKLTTTRTAVNLAGPLAAALKRPGTYYWGLRWTDADGDVSLPSPGRRLFGVDATDAIRLSFPPDGYRIADSLVAAARFAWKSEVGARAVFQLARDPGFGDIACEEAASAGTFTGHEWKSGRYYWRLCTYNADGSVFLESPARSFEIVEPLASPVIESPAPGSTLCLREGDSASLSWTPVEGADYYAVTLRSAADGYASAVFEKEFSKDSNPVCPLGDLPSGTYRLSVQGFAASGEMSTVIPGDVGETSFSDRRLSYIKLESPGDGDHVPGLDARKGVKIFAYDLADQPDSAELEVSTDPGGSNVVARAFDRSGRASVGRLDPGVYYWTVTGRLDGLDISAKRRFRFSIDPIPPLPAPELALPARDEIIGPARLREARSILFSWNPVEGANRYDLAIFAQGKSAPIFRQDNLETTSYSLKDLSVLDKGRFTWTVEARSYDEKGEIEQAGREALSSFTIDLPALPEAKIDEGAELYGF